MKFYPIRFLKNNEYMFSSTKHVFNVYKLIYEELCLEHAKNLYTPYGLLNDIIKICLENNHCTFLLKYSTKDILQYIKSSYKYYEKFCIAFNKIQDKTKFNIYVAYIEPQNPNDYNEFYKYFNPRDVELIKSIGSQTTGKGSCLNPQEFGKNCFIILNKDLLENANYEIFEKVLDHEINHYFQLIDEENKVQNYNDFQRLQKQDEMKVINQKIKKIAFDLGYDLDEPGTRLHLINQTEFISMTSDVCNIVEKQHLSYYEWLDMCTESFIKSPEFLKQDLMVQDVIFFSFMVRWLDSKRWNKLKESVYIQLNSPKINFIKSVKHYLHTWLLKLKY